MGGPQLFHRQHSPSTPPPRLFRPFRSYPARSLPALRSPSLSVEALKNCSCGITRRSSLTRDLGSLQPQALLRAPPESLSSLREHLQGSHNSWLSVPSARSDPQYGLPMHHAQSLLQTVNTTVRVRITTHLASTYLEYSPFSFTPREASPGWLAEGMIHHTSPPRTKHVRNHPSYHHSDTRFFALLFTHRTRI